VLSISVGRVVDEKRAAATRKKSASDAGQLAELYNADGTHGDTTNSARPREAGSDVNETWDCVKR